MNKYFPNLFEEGKIGNRVVKNRIILSPMEEELANTDGTLSEAQFAYYEERAKGGAGVIMLGMVSPDFSNARLSEHQLAMDDPKYISGMKHMADIVHKEGALLIPQIAHCGWNTTQKINNGNPVQAVSYNRFNKLIADTFAANGIKKSLKDSQVHELTVEDFEQQIKKQVQCALYLQEAGCDGAELHGAHAYLINELLIKLFNRRRDKFGGSLKNRARFLIEVIKGIREACREDFIIAVRLPARDYMPLGLGLSASDTLKIAKMCEEAGADLIDITGGIDPTSKNSLIIEPQGFKEAFRAHTAKQFTDNLMIPVTTVGVLKTPEKCERLLEQNIVNFVSIGRGLIADPYWAKKAEEGRSKEIRRCISCNEGCIGPMSMGMEVPIRCTVNPRAGRELEDSVLRPAEEKKKVVIIGGGPAGMQCAATANERGHNVVLIEKLDKLGGQLNLAEVPPDKEFIGWAADWLIDEIHRLDIDIRLNTEASVDLMKSLNPDEIFLATGAKPFTPPIKGVESILQSWDILKGSKQIETGKNVIVIGGGLVGLETALYVAANGCKVSVVEMMDEVAKGLEPLSKNILLKSLKKQKVKQYVSTKVVSIDDGFIEIENNEKKRKIKADEVVMAVGQEPAGLELGEAIKEAGFNVHKIGDCNEVSKIIKATEAGYLAAVNI